MANPNPSPSTRFEPGQSGNPGGKPIGARNRLNAAFLNALAEQFEENGKDAIRSVATLAPDVFVRVLAGILPKEVEVSHPIDDLSDEQLNAAALAIRTILSAQGSGEGASQASEPEQTS